MVTGIFPKISGRGDTPNKVKPNMTNDITELMSKAFPEPDDSRLNLFVFKFCILATIQLIRNALWPSHVGHKEEYSFFFTYRQLLTFNELFQPFHA